LQPEEEAELQRRLRAGTVSVRDRRRSEIILLSAEGLTQQQIADRVGISRLRVGRWVGRFAANRLAGLNDAPGAVASRGWRKGRPNRWWSKR
jgi:transposase